VRSSTLEGGRCQVCRERLRKSRVGKVLFCSTECKRYKEALASRGLAVQQLRAPPSRSTPRGSVISRVALRQVKKPSTCSWGRFLLSRPPIRRKKSSKAIVSSTSKAAPKKVMKRATPPPPPPPPRRQLKPKSVSCRAKRPERVAAAKVRAAPVMKKKASRQELRTTKGQRYLSSRGITAPAAKAKTGSATRSRKKTPTTRYVPKPRSQRTQAVRPTRIGRVPGKKQRLKAWCCERAEGYGIKIRNFTGSWKSGRAFCAIVYSACPSASRLAPAKTKALKARARLKLAFDTAHTMLGVEPLLEPEDITDLPRPDEKCIMLYVSMLHAAIAQRGL